MSAATIPSLLVARATSHPADVALRYFRRGKWTQVTYTEFQARAATLGAGMSAIGVQRDDIVAIVSSDGPLALAAEIGAQGIGGRVVAINPELSAEATRSLLRSAGAKCVLVDNQEQFDKIDEAMSEVPGIQWLIVDSLRGLRSLESLDRDNRETVLTTTQLGSRGDSNTWIAGLNSLQSSAIARIQVLGNQLVPKSHEELIAVARSTAETLKLTTSDVLFPLHSVCDAAEHALQVAGPLLHGATLNFGQPEQLARNIAQTQPTLLHGTGKWIADLDAAIARQTSATSGLKALALQKAIRRGVPAATLGGSRRPEITRLAGIVGAITTFAFLLLSVKLHDALRLLVCALIVIAVVLGLVLSGNAGVGPLRKRYGLARCRAVLWGDEQQPDGADALGALGVPLIATNTTNTKDIR